MAVCHSLEVLLGPGYSGSAGHALEPSVKSQVYCQASGLGSRPDDCWARRFFQLLNGTVACGKITHSIFAERRWKPNPLVPRRIRFAAQA